MKSKINQAQKIFEQKLGGHGDIHDIHAVFKANGIFDETADEYKVFQYEIEGTRKLLRNMSVIIETSEGSTRIRGVHNISKQQPNGKVTFEYIMLRKMTMEEIEVLARRYQCTGRVYVAIGDTLMEVYTGQLMLFDVMKK